MMPFTSSISLRVVKPGERCSRLGHEDRRITVLVVEDHVATREEMCALIGRQNDMRVIAQSDSGEQAVLKANDLQPEVVVMDILLPGMTGIEAAAAIMKGAPHTRVIGLSNHCGRSLVQSFLDAGGIGYVRKDRAFDELVLAIRSASSASPFMGKHVKD
jgi:DNA-binding NarL/FixJ family response regulator